MPPKKRSPASSPLSDAPASPEPTETTTITKTARATATRKRKATIAGSNDEDPASPPPASISATTATSTTTTVTKKRRTTTKNPSSSASTSTMAAPLAARTTATALRIGAHVSMAKGIHNALTNAHHIGANSLALFLKSQRKWSSPALPAADIAAWHAKAAALSYNPRTAVLPHASYLVNLAQPDPAKAQQAYDNFLDDIRRCELLGVAMHNFHPGSAGAEPRDEACARVAAMLNRVHAETEFCKTVIENMAGAGNVLGGRFEDIRLIIDGVEDKARVGVCLDTCHMFAAGYDIRTKDAWERTMAEFERVVGKEFLCALHLNDSKAPLGSRRDLHANIGTGWIGLEGFRVLVNDERVHGLPMVLETPVADGEVEVYAREIKLLEGLVGVEAGDEAFRALAEELWEKGRAERERIGGQVEKRKGKAEAKGRGKKAAEGEDGCESCGEEAGAKKVKRAGRREVKVEEEAVEVAPRKRAPRRAAAKKSLKEESSAGEEE